MVRVRDEHPLRYDGSINLELWLEQVREKSKVGPKFGKQIIDPNYPLSFGVVREETRRKRRVGDMNLANLANLAKWGWLVVPRKRSKSIDRPVPAMFAESKIFDAGYEEFTEELRNSLQSNKKNEFAVFVHGCCVSFQTSVQQAADLHRGDLLTLIRGIRRRQDVDAGGMLRQDVSRSPRL